MLWPILFTSYVFPLGNIIREQAINCHCYSDTQLYLSLKPDDTDQYAKHEACIIDIHVLLTYILETHYSGATVRSLEVIFDQDLSFHSCKFQGLPSSTFWTLQKSGTSCPKRCREFVHTFVTSRLDDCNSLLPGCPIHLERLLSWSRMLLHVFWQEFIYFSHISRCTGIL